MRYLYNTSLHQALPITGSRECDNQTVVLEMNPETAYQTTRPDLHVAHSFLRNTHPLRKPSSNSFPQAASPEIDDLFPLLLSSRKINNSMALCAEASHTKVSAHF